MIGFLFRFEPIVLIKTAETKTERDHKPGTVVAERNVQRLEFYIVISFCMMFSVCVVICLAKILLKENMNGKQAYSSGLSCLGI